MAEEAAPLDLHAFGAAARSAVSSARSEAARLGHDRVGTEHLLLGVLADGTTAASRVLDDHGATAASVRTKVLEVRPRRAASAEPPETATERAVRAIGRSGRFSQRRHHAEVTTEDLLTGVLDVEGTAGQVLRSLGIDVDEVRATLDGAEGRQRSGEPVLTTSAGSARCPSCGGDVRDGIEHHVVEAGGPLGGHAVDVYSCARCGVVLGASGAGPGRPPPAR